MDSYGQIGPDKAGYWNDVKAVRAMLTAGDTVVLEFAANSTAMSVVLVLLDAAAVLKRPTGFATQNPLFIGINEGKSAWLPAESYLHPAYVGQYLGHPWGWHDTSNIEDEPFVAFLNQVLGHVPVGV